MKIDGNQYMINMVEEDNRDGEFDESGGADRETQVSVDNFEGEDQYREGHCYGDHKDEVLANYKDREKQAGEIGWKQCYL
jgi:hypothetical protein